MAAKKKVFVRMLTAMAGADRSLAHGQSVELDERVAREWVKAGMCEMLPGGEALGAERDGLAHTVKRLEAENAELRAELASLKTRKLSTQADIDEISETEPPIDPAA